MTAEPKAFRTFEDLEVYQLAREFRKAMYAISRQLPAFEKFELASQIRRAAVSLTNNIAEGHGRYHYLEQIKFTLQSRGSLQELIDDLNVCSDENYLPLPEISKLKDQAWRVYKLMNGYIRYLRDRKAGASLPLHESSPAYGVTEDDLDAILNDSTIYGGVLGMTYTERWANAPFPLTPALSLGERENHLPPFDQSGRSVVSRAGQTFSLSPRERAGVRGNALYDGRQL